MLNRSSIPSFFYRLSGPGSEYKSRETADTQTSFRESFQSALRTTEPLEDIFREAAEAYSVPVNLLKAIGKAESNFNPNAVSHAGAQGVMQLMPATARSLGVENSFDARSNIMGGAKYISSLLEKYNGNTTLALAAYNAGSGNVAKYGGVPPFKETQNYIQKVLGYAGEAIDISGLRADRPAAETRELPVMKDSAGYADAGFTFTKEDASYIVDMMRIRMQGMFSESLMTASEEEDSESGGMWSV